MCVSINQIVWFVFAVGPSYGKSNLSGNIANNGQYVPSFGTAATNKGSKSCLIIAQLVSENRHGT